MCVAKLLPRLPSEIELLILIRAHQDDAMKMRLRKLYGVRRNELEVALNGLMYGVPKGGYEHPPQSNGNYIKYAHRDHVDGTLLHGRYFEVNLRMQFLPNVQ